MMTNQPIRLASRAFALSCIAVLIATSFASAQSSSLEFPYQALVSKNDALVRSGPGEVHYGTQKLAAGQVVEVYRHDPGGWCAIRPVEGSFCIIPESTVEIISEGVGEIKMADTTPFVGTKLGTVEKPLWQVKLREKEKVTLIGQLSWPSPEGHSTVWYQIEPPAGEFRWININDLESLAGETMASVIQPKPSKMPVPPKPVQPVTRPRSTKPTRPIASLPAANLATSTPRPAAELALPPNVTPVRPSYDAATAKHQTDIASVPSNFAAPVQPENQPAEPNNSATEKSDVQLASFAPPELAEPPTPQLQDSGNGWRRATRAIPSDNSSNNSGEFTQSATPRDNRSAFSSSANYNNSNQNFNNPNYNNSNFANQNQRNFNRNQSTQNRANESYNLNSGQPQSSFTGQIRVADASPDRNGLAQQLNQSRLAQTYSGQPSSGVIQTLNNRLTVEMLKAPSAWQLDPLEAATRQFMSTGSYTDQQAGTQFLTKLANCRQVAAGYGGGGSTARGNFGSNNPASFAGSNPNFGSNANFGSNPNVGSNANFGSNANVGFNANAGPNTLGSGIPDSSQFDATGWLNELKQAGGTDPSTYVLQDASGKIIYHVTPIPGLNLSRYLKKRVGVKGQLGFNQKWNLRHVTIDRVFPL